MTIPTITRPTISALPSEMMRPLGGGQESFMLSNGIQVSKSGVGSIFRGFNAFSNTAKKVGSYCSEFFNAASKVAEKTFLWKQVTDIAFAPFYLFHLGENCLKVKNGSPEQRKNAAFDTATRARDLGLSVGSFVMGLQGLKAISTSTRWLGPFVGILSFLSVASIVGNIRTRSKMSQLAQEMETAEKKQSEDRLESYLTVASLLRKKQRENSDFFSKVFHTPENKMVASLESLEKQVKADLTSSDAETRAKAAEKLKIAISGLKNRVKAELTSSTLSAVASTVSLLATFTFFVCPIAGLALFGISSIVDFGNLIHSKVANWSLEKDIGLKRTCWERLTC